MPMCAAGGQSKRYEEHALVLDVRMRARSATVRGREGTMVTALGDGRFTLLEIMASDGAAPRPGQRICIGREGRDGVEAVLGRIPYAQASPAAQAELRGAVEKIVGYQEERFVEYANTAGPLTQHVHALEMMPGVTKAQAMAMVEERQERKFSSYRDIEERAGVEGAAGRMAQMVLDEITGEARTRLFAKP